MPLKVRDMIKLIEADGWRLLRVRGSHRHYVHPARPGVVTIPGKLAKDLRSILKQAGIDRGPR